MTLYKQYLNSNRKKVLTSMEPNELSINIGQAQADMSLASASYVPYTQPNFITTTEDHEQSNDLTSNLEQT